MDGILKQKILMLLEKNKLNEITPEELSQYDGKDGRPAYVAVDGVVYNVTGYPVWENGTHFDLVAGIDATEIFKMCHDRTILEKLETVGRLVK